MLLDKFSLPDFLSDTTLEEHVFLRSQLKLGSNDKTLTDVFSVRSYIVVTSD